MDNLQSLLHGFTIALSAQHLMLMVVGVPAVTPSTSKTLPWAPPLTVSAWTPA